jgi:hypothetical protein
MAMAGPALAQDDDDVQPAPPSVGADIPLTYFGPAPSSTDPTLIGPVQLLTAGELDLDAGTITLPLYRGHVEDGDETTWFVVTDTTDADNAAALGVNHSAKLFYAQTCRGVRDGVVEQDGSVTFEVGRVDFAAERTVVPGEAPNYFPPAEAEPGSIGDEWYTPLVRLINAGGHIYNAPVVATGEADEIEACGGDPDYDRVHDKVVRICPSEGTVTLSLSPGFSFARPVLYLSLDANHPLPAALEGATYAPGLEDVAVGRDDSLNSAVERIFVFINGPTGTDNPQRQGLNSALSDGRGPLNVLGGIPTLATDYSPLWDMNVGVWTEEAAEAGYPARLTEEFQILGMVQRGLITGPDGATYGSTGFIVNCPIVHRFL